MLVWSTSVLVPIVFVRMTFVSSVIGPIVHAQRENGSGQSLELIAFVLLVLVADGSGR